MLEQKSFAFIDLVLGQVHEQNVDRIVFQSQFHHSCINLSSISELSFLKSEMGIMNKYTCRFVLMTKCVKILVKGLTHSRLSGSADSSSFCVPLKCAGNNSTRKLFHSCCLIFWPGWRIWCGGKLFYLLHAGHYIVNCIPET